MKIRNAEILNSKKIKNIMKLLQEQWGYEEKLDFGFLQKENDVFLVSRDIDKIDLGQLHVNSLGLYFAELRNNELRLSIEGSQIIAKKAKKNVISLSDDQLQQWLTGQDIELDDASIGDVSSNYESNCFALIRHNDDFFGCGRVKQGILLNFVPKSRRLSH